MSRIVPVYIDLDTGKYVVKESEIDGNFRTYTLNITTPSNSWVLFHVQGTKSIIIKIYSQNIDNEFEEIKPDSIILTDRNTVTVNFNSLITGIAHLMVWDINSLA